MKRLVTIVMFGIMTGIFATSCNKEYTCECDGYSTIVEAGTDSEARNICDTKGTNCTIK